MANPHCVFACVFPHNRCNILISQDDFYNVLVQRHGKERQHVFSRATVGIAGLGGLGSHVAILLTRLGIGTLVLVDFDTVDISNLHRQHYSMQDVGQYKNIALEQQLHAINPYIMCQSYTQRLSSENLGDIFPSCQVICEAFDVPQQKAMITEYVLSSMPTTYLVGASGMAGIGDPNNMCVKKPMKRYYLCGDGTSDVAHEGTLFAPRVALCAAQQATVVMRILLGEL